MDNIASVTGQMWNGLTWTALPFNTLAFTGDTTDQGFDVAYESQSGDAILVWNNGAGGTASVSYRVWDGITWSAEATVTAPDAGVAEELRLEASATGNEMVLIVSDDNTDEWAAVVGRLELGNSVVLDTL